MTLFSQFLSKFNSFHIDIFIILEIVRDIYSCFLYWMQCYLNVYRFQIIMMWINEERGESFYYCSKNVDV
ncbi:hypothetical protein ADS79_00355 [Brevibacillus reuszeri]|uniref:Uncharacterized protein n=1 Tax=Brevibacillus reuszeri TaxID=54915 RepID=A0A0K9Z1K1_9BACL|nr:hypothetical protein ADS79_00355 [Brevibacillus reuszeri]